MRSKINDPSSVTWKNIPHFKSKQANMVQESLKVYHLVIFLALAVSFVSGKINVTNNIVSPLRCRVSILRLGHSN